ncbi:hypothetical protein A5791_02520 [Mycobacterium sp. 852002-51163_SCH5372311]|nr:hypothetical protein A5791_02520 [Mycobacterium sp. 852002-51163_SCH5372311]
MLAAKKCGFPLVGHTGHGIDAGYAHRRVGVAKLCGGGAEAFDESAFFEILLAAVGNDKGNCPTNSSDGGKRGFKDVCAVRGLRIVDPDNLLENGKA